MNKTSLNYASAYELIPDLGLEGHRYAWVSSEHIPCLPNNPQVVRNRLDTYFFSQCASVFNFGFLFWSVPTNFIIQKVPIAKYTAVHIFIWSLLLCCHAAVTNYAGMLAIRFLLGMFEAAIAPSAMEILSMWYTRDELPLRLCTVVGFNGLAAMVSSLLSFGLGHAKHAAIPSWKLVFLVYGALNFTWAIIFLLFVPDSPADARFLSHGEKVVATWRTSRNMVGVKTTQYKPSQILEAFLDFKVWCTTILGAAAGIIVGGVTNFMTAIIKVR